MDHENSIDSMQREDFNTDRQRSEEYASRITPQEDSKISEELRDLEQEVADAQFAYDADQTALVNALRFINMSQSNLDQAKKNLLTFKEENNV